MSSLPERRRVSRVRTTLEGRLRQTGGAPIPVHIQDVSVVGAHLLTPVAMPAGTRCLLEMNAEGGSIEVRGTVVRSHGDSLALRFEELPFESFEPLRAFLLLHAENPAVIADEISERLGHLGETA